MAIYRILQNVAFEPEHIDALAKAYEDTLRSLHLANRNDPITETIAKTIIELAQRGERDASRLHARALAGLGMPPPTKATAEQPSKGDAGKAASSKTVLIVEDDEAFAYAASRHLRQVGYQTVVVGSSLAAFREIEQKPVDLVISDVCLHAGEPHGVALGRMIRNRDPGLPVILITAFPDLLEKEKPLPGPAFTKPVSLVVLAAAVKAMLPS